MMGEYPALSDEEIQCIRLQLFVKSGGMQALIDYCQTIITTYLLGGIVS